MRINIAVFFGCMVTLPCITSCQNKEIITEREITLSKELVLYSEKVNQGSPRWFEILDSAILLNPNNASAHREKSVWYTKTGDYVRAYELLNKAVELDPLDALGYRGWLRLYKLHDYEGAINDLERLDVLTPNLTDYPWSENLYYLTGLAKSQLGLCNEALTDFDRYITEVTKKQGENWVEIYTFVDKGICLRTLNQFDSAIAAFNKAIKYYNECPEAHFQKAITFNLMQKYPEACDSFQKAMIYAKQGRIRTDPYKDYFNQLYVEDIDDNLLKCK